MENSKHGLAQPSGAESAQPQVDPIEIQLKDYPIPVLDEGYCDVSKQGQLPYYLESLPMDTRAGTSRLNAQFDLYAVRYCLQTTPFFGSLLTLSNAS